MTETERAAAYDSLLQRTNSLYQHWSSVVEAAKAIGLNHRELHSSGAILSSGKNFGNLRFPVYYAGRHYADILSTEGSQELEYVFLDSAPDWFRSLVERPAQHPLSY